MWCHQVCSNQISPPLTPTDHRAPGGREVGCLRGAPPRWRGRPLLRVPQTCPCRPLLQVKETLLLEMSLSGSYSVCGPPLASHLCNLIWSCIYVFKDTVTQVSIMHTHICATCLLMTCFSTGICLWTYMPVQHFRFSMIVFFDCCVFLQKGCIKLIKMIYILFY